MKLTPDELAEAVKKIITENGTARISQLEIWNAQTGLYENVPPFYGLPEKEKQ